MPLALHNARSPGTSYRPSSRQPWEIAAHGPKGVVQRRAGQGLPRALQNYSYIRDCWRHIIAFVLRPGRVYTITHPKYCHKGIRTGTRVNFCAILLYTDTRTTLPHTSTSVTKGRQDGSNHQIRTGPQAHASHFQRYCRADRCLLSCPAHAQQCRELLKCVGSRLRRG